MFNKLIYNMHDKSIYNKYININNNNSHNSIYDEEKKQSRIPKTLSIICNYIDYDSASIIEEYLIKDVNDMFTVGEYGICELLDYDIDCLYGACLGGHIDIVKRFTYTYAYVNRKISWDCALRHACEGGNMEVINFIINDDKNKKLNWNGGLHGACKSGKIDIVNLIINKSENKKMDWDGGMINACKGGNIDIVKLMIERDGGKWLSWNSGLGYACKYGYTSIIKLMVSKGANFCPQCKRRVGGYYQ